MEVPATAPLFARNLRVWALCFYLIIIESTYPVGALPLLLSSSLEPPVQVEAGPATSWSVADAWLVTKPPLLFALFTTVLVLLMLPLLLLLEEEVPVVLVDDEPVLLVLHLTAISSHG
jgi:hypothetical protein